VYLLTVCAVYVSVVRVRCYQYRYTYMCSVLAVWMNRVKLAAVYCIVWHVV
jgi:hypothetical protein